MATPWERKSTPDEIRARFDLDVERFSSLETGQRAIPDSTLYLELVAKACAAQVRPGDAILDLGCGAGNFTLRVLQERADLHCHLVDLSRPMLDRAESRLRKASAGEVHTYQKDLRALSFPENSFACILAGAVLHHLRTEAEWEAAFQNFQHWLQPNGRLIVTDMMFFDCPDVQQLMWKRYGDYLESLEGPGYRDKVFAYIDREDTPRSLAYQLDLLRRSGFQSWDVLHRNSVFACYLGVK